MTLDSFVFRSATRIYEKPISSFFSREIRVLYRSNTEVFYEALVTDVMLYR
jgi:hypothetical protein